MIKGIFFNSKNIFQSNSKLFQVVCTYQYRKKTIPVPYPFQERFDVLDGQYLVPKPPLKPLSAYNVFTLMYMRIIRENYPNEPTSVILKKLSSLWNDDEFMIDHKLEVLNLIKYQNYQYYNEMLYYKKIYAKPKLPLSSFQIYLKERYIQVKEELQTSDIATITQHVTYEWSQLTEEQKQEYQQKYKDNIVYFKTAISEYDNTFRIPMKQYKNIYNLFVIEQYQGKKIKFKSLEEHQKFTKQLQVMFNQLTPQEKQFYEQKKIQLDEQINQEAEKFKKYFDLSEQDYQDIQKLVKSQSKIKDINEDPQIAFM
ncbi:high mobility group (HMG)-box protein (macronuclear) [Tetrahymena thermophila SB210]|uniref:High mobility group (HMG)-box protein n=1 Tax=Tetrahymena thermophila (strain SB210) TaxID=312017 RepID=I7M472_TETTS|nr:high mobility group (HMG)-box protein [Tetrahymena thermophila SB210]EAS05035.2 high mobility group (HMG)-box protein [Tetrahymena thermophila SB210]|eukprot:XP_001025280.2 high mobility group (HMG)-box protein [Tetrahymena thermophila SB210]